MQPSGYVHESILRSTATRLKIILVTATESSKLFVYKETIEAILNMLYKTSLRIIKQRAIKLLEEDIREMISGLRRVNKDGIIETRKYLEKAQVKATLALSMFGRDEEEISKTRLENRYEALIECRGNLEKALEFISPMIPK